MRQVISEDVTLDLNGDQIVMTESLVENVPSPSPSLE
jgi:hypothetical protein